MSTRRPPIGLMIAAWGQLGLSVLLVTLWALGAAPSGREPTFWYHVLFLALTLSVPTGILFTVLRCLHRAARQQDLLRELIQARPRFSVSELAPLVGLDEPETETRIQRLISERRINVIAAATPGSWVQRQKVIPEEKLPRHCQQCGKPLTHDGPRVSGDRVGCDHCGTEQPVDASRPLLPRTETRRPWLARPPRRLPFTLVLEVVLNRVLMHAILMTLAVALPFVLRQWTRPGFTWLDPGLAALGLGLLVTLWQGRRDLRLLRLGVEVPARLVDRSLRPASQTPAGSYRGVWLYESAFHTHHQVDAPPERDEAEPQTIVLHRLEARDRGVLLRDLPGRPLVLPSGDLQHPHPRRLIPVLLPLAAVVISLAASLLAVLP